MTSRWRDTPVTSPRERWRLAFPLSSLAALPAGALERGLGELGSKKLNRAHKLPSRLTFKGTTGREMCETRTRSMLVPAGLGWVWGVPVSRARLLLGFRSGHPPTGTSEQSRGRQGTPRGCCRPRAAASAREPSCARGRRCPSAAGRPDSGTHSNPGPQPSRPPGRAEASELSVPPAPAALGSRPRAVGEGGWVVAEEEEGSGGGDQPAPARPSTLPRPDTAPGAEMADEPQKKPHLSALVGHTNGLTKPASLAGTRSTGGGGGGGGATASSKKLVIKNFRGGYGAGRALSAGRCARPDLCLLQSRPLPAPCPRPGPAAVTRPAAVSGRGAAAAGLITPWLIALPAPCP